MSATLLLFWIGLAILFYCYAGYGLVLFAMEKIRGLFSTRPKKQRREEAFLPVTLIVTAFDEEEVLKKKIENSLAIDYPSEKLNIIFITDGSADSSPSLVKRYESIRLMHQPERQGKSAAIKRAMRFVQTPIVIFSDANSMLNKDCIKHMMPHYRSSAVGAVAGEKKIIKNDRSAVSKAEGLYWQYESFMKKRDAGLYTVTGAAGELYSIRTGLFRQISDEVILDDFVISLQVCLRGCRIAYEPRAFASEVASASLGEEEKRKVRIAAGAYHSLGYLSDCLNIFKYPLLGLQFISRKILRWIVCPLLLPFLLFANILIVSNQPAGGFYYWFLIAQALLYTTALAGWIIIRKGKNVPVFTIPFYFLFMNYCQVKGFIKFISGKQTVLWEKSLRQVMEP